MSIFECLVDEFLTCDLIHRRVAEFRLAGPYGAVSYCLINDIPCINDVFVTVYDCLDVMFHVGIELLLGKQVTFFVLIDPGTYLRVPHKAVATQLDAVLAAEVGNLVGILPVEFTFTRFSRLGFHVVLSSDAVELPLDESDLLRGRNVPLIYSHSNHEVVFVSVLHTVSDRLRSSLTKLCHCGKAECHGADSNKQFFHRLNFDD